MNMFDKNNYVSKYFFTYDAFVSVILLVFVLLLMKTSAELEHIKQQAISHGFAKYDETKGNWRWITEEDMHN